VADYSEFPTTPTAWREVQAQEWETVTPLATEDPEPPRGVDRTALAAGLVFVVLAVVGLAEPVLPEELFDGVLVWIVVIAAGLGLLVSELSRARRRRR
jgi:hypothetical protein